MPIGHARRCQDTIKLCKHAISPYKRQIVEGSNPQSTLTLFSPSLEHTYSSSRMPGAMRRRSEHTHFRINAVVVANVASCCRNVPTHLPMDLAVNNRASNRCTMRVHSTYETAAALVAHGIGVGRVLTTHDLRCSLSTKQVSVTELKHLFILLHWRCRAPEPSRGALPVRGWRT